MSIFLLPLFFGLFVLFLRVSSNIFFHLLGSLVENVLSFGISSALQTHEFLLGTNISTIDCRILGTITGHHRMALRRAH